MAAACSTETAAHNGHTIDLQVTSIARKPNSGPKLDADSFRKTDIMILCNQMETCANMKQVVETGQDSILRTSPTILHPLSSKNINTARSTFKTLKLRNYRALRNTTGMEYNRNGIQQEPTASDINPFSFSS